MKACEALVIGGSAGSLDVLLKVLPELNPVLSFPVIIVMHRKSGKDSILTDLLSAKTQLPVKEIEEKEQKEKEEREKNAKEEKQRKEKEKKAEKRLKKAK